MIDKHLEQKIKKTKDFIDLWAKFNSIYKSALSKSSISAQDQDVFANTREGLEKRYKELHDLVKNDIPKISRGRESIKELLAIESIQALSDKEIDRAPGLWQDSYALLNAILERLEKKKKRIERFNSLIFFAKKITRRKS